MPRTSSAIEAVNSAIVSPATFLGWVFAVPTVFADVPDREDVLLVADADLDLGFLMVQLLFRSVWHSRSERRRPWPYHRPRVVTGQRIEWLKIAQSRFLC